VAFLLEELRVSYERRVLDLVGGENKQPAYLAVHPHGLVPALRDDDTVVYETAAICLYLADRYGEPRLAPEPGSPDRAAYYQWAVYSVATLEPALADLWIQRQSRAGERCGLYAATSERFRSSADVLSTALAAPYLVGGRFTAADVLVGSMLVWAQAMELLDRHPRLAEYAARVAARPAFGRS
jgi:glutathione S-transferase